MGADTSQKTVPPASGRITPRDAAIAAAKYFMEVTGYTGGFTVEEIVLSQDRGRWLVTLGYAEQPIGTGTTVPLFGAPKKAYKVFEIDAESGQVLSMKIKEG